MAEFLTITLYVVVGIVAFLATWSFRAVWRYRRRQEKRQSESGEDIEQETEEQQG